MHKKSLPQPGGFLVRHAAWADRAVPAAMPAWVPS